MKLFDAAQTKEWDRITLERQEISSWQLMETAGQRCYRRIAELFPDVRNFVVFCGKGNNGGDGLVIARYLAENLKQCIVFVPEAEGSADQQENLRMYRDMGREVHLLKDVKEVNIPADALFIDALFGTGLHGPLTGEWKELVEWINNQPGYKISIDVPSGIPGELDAEGKDFPVVKANATLSLQKYKPLFFVYPYSSFAGRIELVDIGLDEAYEKETDAIFGYADEAYIRTIYKPRDSWQGKAGNGHLLLAGGSRNTAGAVLLAARSALKSGAGLCSVCLPWKLLPALNNYLPEAMYAEGNGDVLLSGFPLKTGKYSACAIGPGMGTKDSTADALIRFLENNHLPGILDADALNIIARMGRLDLLESLVITPHSGEFDRLFGVHTSQASRTVTAMSKARQLGCVIVLKGPNTFIAGADHHVFNSSGNAALAKGGSGDVLTGCIGALLCQGYTPFEAAVLAVYLHGKAADISLQDMGMESLLAGELCEYLGKAFKHLNEHT